MTSGRPVQRLRSAAFLDRDGVLNVDRGYVSDRADFEWIPGAQEAIRHLNDAGYLVVVVTNQSGIARGLYTEREFAALHRWMDDCLRTSEAHIDAVYLCPHLPDAGMGRYRVECECRKPRPGMLLQAISDLDIASASSFLIGDKPSDLAAAEAAGIASHRFTGPNLLQLVRRVAPTVNTGAVHSDT
jgi:D-glycero-D-manno-heptose 1,7-bisphosphate phosphatase